VHTLSTLLPTRILTTEPETYVSSSVNHLGSASKDSLLDTSYTAKAKAMESVRFIDEIKLHTHLRLYPVHHDNMMRLLS
jgi:hypothetical protein